MTDENEPVDSKRKSPKQNRAEQTVDMIYDATTQILQKDGEEKLTTATIAARSGFSIGTLYQYFRNKDALLVAMAWHERERINAEIHAALKDAAHKPLSDVVRNIVQIMLKIFSGRFRARKLVIKALISNTNLKPFIAAQNEVIKLIAEEMRNSNHPELGPIDATTTYVMSRALIGTIRSAIMEESSLLGTKAFEDELVRLLTGYLSKPT